MTAPAARKGGFYQSKPEGEYDAPSVSSIVKPVEAIACAHHRAEWDIKAKKGTTVHAVMEAWAKGESYDVPFDCVGFVDALEGFFRAFDPHPILVEATVVRPGELAYGGTLDLIAEIDGEVWLLDAKTGKIRTDVVLQLAGYSNATNVGLYDGFGRLEHLDPMPRIDRCGVIDLDADGTHRLLPVEVGERQFEAFMHLRRFFDVAPSKEIGKAIKPKVVAA